MNSMPDLENYQYLPEATSEDIPARKAKSVLVSPRQHEFDEFMKPSVGWILVNDFLNKPFQVSKKIYNKESLLEPDSLLDKMIIEEFHKFKNRKKQAHKKEEEEEKQQIEEVPEENKKKDEVADRPTQTVQKNQKPSYLLPRIIGNLVGVIGGPTFMKFAAETLESNYSRLKNRKNKEKAPKDYQPVATNPDEVVIHEDGGLMEEESEQKKDYVDILL